MKLKELKELIECCSQNNVAHLKDAEVELSFHVAAKLPVVVAQENVPELTPEDLAKQKELENDRLMFMSS